jgi:hypothetical protein
MTPRASVAPCSEFRRPSDDGRSVEALGSAARQEVSRHVRDPPVLPARHRAVTAGAPDCDAAGGEGSRAAGRAGNRHGTAPIAPECQSFLDNLPAGFGLNGSWNNPHRASDFESEGREFESLRARQINQRLGAVRSAQRACLDTTWADHGQSLVNQRKFSIDRCPSEAKPSAP